MALVLGREQICRGFFFNFKILQRYDNPTANFANSQLICTYCRVKFDWLGYFNFVSNVCYTHVVLIPTWPISASLALGRSYALLWRHNGRDSISNHQPHDCLLKRLFRRRSKITSKLRVTGLCGGIHRGPVNSPHKWPVTRKMFPFDDVIMDSYWEIVLLPRWWRRVPQCNREIFGQNWVLVNEIKVPTVFTIIGLYCTDVASF